MIYRGPCVFAGRMNRLLAHPLNLLSRQQVVSLSQSSCVSTPVELTDGRGGEGVGEEQNHTIARKPGPLYII
jgi:hypothetical protein